MLKFRRKSVLYFLWKYTLRKYKWCLNGEFGICFMWTRYTSFTADFMFPKHDISIYETEMPVFRKFPDFRKFIKKVLDFRKFSPVQKNRSIHFSRKFLSISGNFDHNGWHLWWKMQFTLGFWPVSSHAILWLLNVKKKKKSFFQQKKLFMSFR